MPMISVGKPAPAIVLDTQFGTKFDLSKYRGKSLVMLIFYPRDFTPTCSHEVPTADRMCDLFAQEAKTQLVAISTDSRFSHNAWGADNGGVAYPILADCNPYGAVSQAYGAWVPADQISDRATVVIDRQGVVQYAQSVGVNGRRNVDELFETAKGIAARDPQARAPYDPPRRFTRPATLYVTSTCHFSTRVIRCAINLHCEDDLELRFVDQDPAALEALRQEFSQRLPGSQPTVPCLVSEDGVARGGDQIMTALAARYAKAIR